MGSGVDIKKLELVIPENERDVEGTTGEIEKRGEVLTKEKSINETTKRKEGKNRIKKECSIDEIS